LDVEALAKSADISASINTALTTLRENISLARASVLRAPGGAVGGYLHNNGAFGALVGATGAPASELLQALLAKIAQHSVAIDPGLNLYFLLFIYLFFYLFLVD
jgi:translation elongation factor EF-Ts